MEVDQVAESLPASIIIYAAQGFQLMENDPQFERLGGFNLTPSVQSSPGLAWPGVHVATFVFFYGCRISRHQTLDLPRT